MGLIKLTKYIIILTAIFGILLINISSCVKSDEASIPDVKNEDGGGKIKIIATLFPQYDFARQIAGDKADVTLLLPPGVESHGFDPKPGDIIAIYNSDLFIYTGSEMEPWSGNIIKGIDHLANPGNLTVVDCSEGIELLHGGDDSHDYDHGADPHIWLDPTQAVKIIENILAALIKKDPANSDFYTNNADSYKEKLMQFNEDAFDAIKNAERDTIVFGGRFAYIYFLHHFELNYITAYDSCSSAAEPSAGKIADIIDYIKERGIPYIYHEELADPKVAKSIAEAANIGYLQFSTAHNVTKKEFDEGITFLDIMYANLENLKKGLN